MKRNKDKNYYNSLEIRREANLEEYKKIELKSFEKWQNKLNKQLEEEREKREIIEKYYPNSFKDKTVF